MLPGFALHQAGQLRFGFLRQARGGVSVDQARNLARGALAQDQAAFLEPAVAVGAIDDQAGEIFPRLDLKTL
jgi:hypothetical protein